MTSHHPLPPGSAPVLAVVSGKGGVGKSTLAVNLAETFAAQGCAVALLDADLGTGSCATLMNETPAATAIASASGVVPVDRVLTVTASGVTLAAGGTLPPDLTFEHVQPALDETLRELAATHDLVIVDAPAGLGAEVRWSLDRADAALLVLVGEPTSVKGAYTLAKMVWGAVPDYPLLSVVNAADTESEAQEAAARFSELTAQFLGHEPIPLGWVPYSPHVRAAVSQQTPAVRLSGSVRAAFTTLSTGLRELALLPI